MSKFRILFHNLATKKPNSSLLYTNNFKPFYSTTSFINNNILQNATETGNVDYINGLVKVTLKLPARGELCEFNLRLLNDNVGTLVENLLIEDKSIEKAQVYTREGVRISQSTPISAIVLDTFIIKINELTYKLEPPSVFVKDAVDGGADGLEMEDMERVKKLVSKLYLHLNVEEFENRREHEIVKELEILKNELGPLEKKREELTIISKKHTNRMVWFGLGLMGVQAGIMARLTWFDYSWDIVEPISYFVSYSAVVGTYAYFVLTRKEYDYASATDRIFLRNFHKNAPKHNLDISNYNQMKQTVHKLENDLRRIKTSQLKNYENN